MSLSMYEGAVWRQAALKKDARRPRRLRNEAMVIEHNDLVQT